MFTEVFMKNRDYNQKIPDTTVYQAAKKYHSAALMLREENFYVAVINAALAIEIYLKSFLITNHSVNGYKMHKSTQKGHDLRKLYNKISLTDKRVLIKTLKEVNPDVDLESEISRYSNIFIDARYMFEPNTVDTINSNVIRLSGALDKAIMIISKSRYPVSTPENLRKLVDQALSAQ